MKRFGLVRRCLLAGSLAVAGLGLSTASAADPTLQELDQKIRILERKFEIDQENAAAQTTPSVSAGSDGFALVSADKAFQLKLRGYTQADARFYTDDPEDKSIDTFLVRRARLIVDGQFGKYFEMRVAPDFGNGKTELQDGYLDFKPDPLFNLRLGRTKVPFGLERLQSTSETFLNEPALSTALTPNYDAGIQLYGSAGKGVLDYAAGIYNGGADGTSVDSDSNDAKDWVGRIFLTPFKNSGPDALRGLSFGIAGTVGDHQGSDSSPNLPSYRTTGQQSFFSYKTSTNKSNTAFADGEQTRLSPQFYYTVGSFGLLGEYILSEQEVANGKSSDSLDNTGWQLTASQVLTGESPSLKGVKPLRPYNPSKGDWGAFELVARYSALNIDDTTFDSGFADSKKSASAAEAVGVGVNWYLTRNAKFALQYEQTAFTDGASDGDRPDEQIVIARAQVGF
jgi:phosphate-selective porin OprO/OprP